MADPQRPHDDPDLPVGSGTPSTAGQHPLSPDPGSGGETVAQEPLSPQQEARLERAERRRTRAGLTVVMTMLVVTMVLALLLVIYRQQA